LSSAGAEITFLPIFDQGGELFEMTSHHLKSAIKLSDFPLKVDFEIPGIWPKRYF
jgi:hypothetical protein